MAALRHGLGPERTTAAERARTIARLDIAPLAIPLTESFAISKGAVATAQNVLVRVVLQDGSAGFGEAAPFEVITGETQRSTLTALRTMIAAVTGRDAASWRVLAADLRSLLPEAAAARCAVEQAVVDALARHLGLALPAFFGGFPHELMTDITIGVGDISHSVESAHQAENSGFKTIKVKIGADDWELDVARIVAISQATPEPSIIVDGNAGFSRYQAHRFLDGVTEAGATVALVEQLVAALVETAVSMTFSAAVAAASYPFFAYIDLDTPLLMPRNFIHGGMRYRGPAIRLPGHAVGTGVDAAAHFAASPGS